MKKLNKLLAIILAVAMIMSLAVTAGATAGSGYTITITNAVVGQTYSAYKIFDVVVSGTVGSGTESYSYTILDNSPFYTLFYSYSNLDSTATTQYFKFTEDTTYTGSGEKKYVVEAGTDFDAVAIAALIKAAIDADPSQSTYTYVASDTAVAANVGDTTAELVLDLTGTGGGDGYYFVNTSLGSLSMLTNAAKTASIQEKNDVPSVDKEVSEVSTGDWEDDNKSDAAIGDTVYYQTTINDLKGLTALTLHDTMDAGLALDTTAGITVTLYYTPDGGSEQNVTLTSTDYAITYNQYHEADVTSGFEDGVTYYTVVSGSNPTEYEVTSDSTPVQSTTYYTYCTFDINFADLLTSSNTNYANSQLDSAYIVVTYQATVTSDAVIYDGTESSSNDNSTYISYNNDLTSTRQKTQTYVYSVNLYKYTGDLNNAPTVLPGARFYLYNADGQYAVFAYDDVEETYTIVSWEDGDPADYVATGTESPSLISGTDGLISVEGLDADVLYHLYEYEAPSGYNLLSAYVYFYIASEDDATASGKTQGLAYTDATMETAAAKSIGSLTAIPVENNSGTEMPETGGIGTTIFYVVGGILVVGAIVLLITKKRLGSEEDK